ncbi:SpaA isopeptide-forming pilin-related protein [Enterococcus rotai]|uniref:SpaA isopeptide-forming pilin-related protein n=1 Tax=Enterococcus rotai TaxID=118060 RepID=UPI0032B4282C
MKQKISYLFFSFVFVLLTLGALGGKQAEAVQGNASWSTGSSVNSQMGTAFTNDYMSNVQNNLLTPSSATSRFFAPVSCGGIQVIKYDERTNARLSGAQFTIYDRWGRAIQVIQTNYNGIAETRSLPLGYYSIKETKAPTGYQLETSALSFSILRAGQFICITKCNKPLPTQTGSLKVNKVGENNQALAGAIFDVYNANNQYVGRIATNANGVATLGNLPYGTYKLIEVQAPNGYELDTTPKYVTISASSPGGVASITISNKKVVKIGSIKVNKIGENNQALAGAVFDVYNANNQYVGRITTNANGVATLGNLPYGTYKLIEVQAPTGYELDATPKYVTISASSPGGVASITISNKKVVKTGTIEVIKKDESGKLLAGAKFYVLNSKNVYVGQITTDANGVATLTNLPYDTYVLLEYEAPEGYELDQTLKYVTLSENSPNGKASITVVNKKKITTGALEVVKKDEAGKLLAGAEFEVRDANDKVVGTITTDANGIATLKDLPYGTYKIIETKAPEGYELDATPKTITISKDDPNGVISITIENKKAKTTGALEVVKKDEAGTLLAGAEFDVYNEKDELVGKITTDANGIGQLDDLPYGTYKLIETKAPEGFELDATPKTVTISKDDPNGKVSVDVINKKIELPVTGSLKITKYVKDSDPTVYLEGAVFEIYDNNNQLIGTHTTDVNGEILLNDLEPGKYYVIEVEAPPGYEQDSTFYEVTVESGKIAEVRHANIKKENLGGLKITKYAKDEFGFETDIVLPNAEFEVKDSAGTIHKGTTDTQGELFFPDLPVGEVTVTETKAPDGYEIDVATQNTKIVAETITEVTFYNQPKEELGRALVYLSSNDAKQTLHGLEYSITCTKGAAFETTVVTNKFGQISTYLPPGEYEIEPVVKGYSTASKATSFKIEANKFTIIRLTI